MPYAGENIISHVPFDGAIEITQDQYEVALNALLAGKLVTIDGGFSIRDAPQPEIELPPEPEPEPEQEPEPEPEQEPEPEISLTEYAAEARWKREVGGIQIGGVHVKTDEISQTKILGARVAADANPDFTTQWKGADGVFTTIDAAMIRTISDVVANHISECFRYEEKVQHLISIGEITTQQQVIEAYSLDVQTFFGDEPTDFSH